MADNYPYDFQRLQQDAIRRAREMQARARVPAPPLNQSAPGPPAAPAAQPSPAPQQHSAPTPAPQHVPAPEAGQQREREPSYGPLTPVKDIFDSLMSDSERTLLLVLILLLTEEKADIGLVFALMYLVL
ncbi:hypothetical protein [Caproiciproducens sp.]